VSNFIFDSMQAGDFENLFFCQEKTFGLKAIIAIHDTTLGPAAGGIRMRPYETEQAAINDAMRLARAMTYKNAAAELAIGGGKCVIIGDPARDKNEGMLRSLARYIDRLGGLFLAGEDVGTTLHDMEIMRTESQYIVTIPESWGGPGDSGSITAIGVFQGMRACLNEVYGSPLPQGRSVAIQGVGSVGTELVRHLTEAGAAVTIADVDQEKVDTLVSLYHVHVAPPEEIHKLAVDVFSPCALGAILNEQTLPELRCKIVCGSANNQLAEDQLGDLLTERGILYAPDYIINAGGVINGIDSLSPAGYNRQRALEKVKHIYKTMSNVIAIAKERHISTARAADIVAEQRIAMIRQVKNLSTGLHRSFLA
jgi:leucine dehydrogenase